MQMNRVICRSQQFWKKRWTSLAVKLAQWCSSEIGRWRDIIERNETRVSVWTIWSSNLSNFSVRKSPDYFLLSCSLFVVVLLTSTFSSSQCHYLHTLYDNYDLSYDPQPFAFILLAWLQLYNVFSTLQFPCHKILGKHTTTCSKFNFDWNWDRMNGLLPSSNLLCIGWAILQECQSLNVKCCNQGHP